MFETQEDIKKRNSKEKGHRGLNLHTSIVVWSNLKKGSLNSNYSFNNNSLVPLRSSLCLFVDN